MNEKQLKFCVLNTLFAFLLFFFLQKSHRLPGENSKMLFLGPILKAPTKTQILTNTKRFLFINTSFDKILVDHYENPVNGPVFKGVKRGQIAITDRRKLTTLFKNISVKANYDYLACNILFDHPSDYDASLLKALNALPKTVVAQGRKKQNLLPGFRELEHFGLDNIYTPSGAFSKYRLFEKENGIVQKSIPLKIYEELHGHEIQPYYFFSRFNNRYIFNDFTPGQEITKYDSLKIVDLGDIVRFPKKYISTLTKDKIIILGDYYNNDKKTIYDQNTPAPLILANAYLSMEKGSQRLTLGLVITLALVFLFFSYLVISKQSKVESKIFKWPIIGGLIGGTTYAIVMGIISLFIFLVFDSNINLIYIGLFFYLENVIINRHFHYLRIKKRFNIGKRNRK